MTTEEKLKEMMIAKSGSINKFSHECGLATSTVVTMMDRGVSKTNINTIIKICRHLGISVDALADGRIEKFPNEPDMAISFDNNSELNIIFEKMGENLQKELLNYAKYLISREENDS